MFKHLCPNQFVEDIYHINLKQLADAGIRGIIADLDNTLVPWNDNKLFPGSARMDQRSKRQRF